MQDPRSSQTSVHVNLYDEMWQYIKEGASSRENYTWIVAQNIFAKEDLQGHRIKGTKDYPELCKSKLYQVKRVVLMYFPILSNEDPIKAWRLCEKNIDTNLRRKVKK